jgi:hypothetical protein
MTSSDEDEDKADEALRLLVEDDGGDLVDILWYCPEHAPEGAAVDPNDGEMDYPCYCEVCSIRLPVRLTDEGVRYAHELRSK